MGWLLLYYMDWTNAIVSRDSRCTVCLGLVAYREDRVCYNSRDVSSSCLSTKRLLGSCCWHFDR